MMMTGVALDHEDRLDDILKGLEDLNKTEAEKRDARKKKKSANEEGDDDVFGNTVSVVTKAAKWKGKGSTSELEKERAKVQPSRSTITSSSSSFKKAAKVNMAANAFGSGVLNKKPSPRGSTSGSDSGSKLTRTKSDKVKKEKAAYKTAENRDGTMTRTYSQKYK